MPSNVHDSFVNLNHAPVFGQMPGAGKPNRISEATTLNKKIHGIQLAKDEEQKEDEKVFVEFDDDGADENDEEIWAIWWNYIV